ncbi:MAG: MobF family relaxase [Cyanobacteria bacterium P01_E01_bin.6]
MVSSISLAKDKGYLIKNYYSNDHEGLGEWLGDGAKTLGLQGKVTSQEFGHVWDGYSPNGKEKLVQNAGSKSRQAGWDITFSPAKDLSILYGLGDEKTQAEIKQAQRAAVVDAVQSLEENAAYTRQGKSGDLEVQTDGLIAAAFQHTTNRENQPQLHTHVMVFNVAPRTDGSTGSIVSRRLYNANLSAGSIHTARIATEMQRLGYEVRPTQDGFEIQGISKEARDAFSTRSAQIAEYLKENNLDNTPQNRDKAAEITRAPKQAMEWETLQHEWWETGKSYGLTPEYLQSLKGRERERSTKEIEQAQKEVIRDTLAYYSKQIEFTERDVEVKIAQQSIGKGLTYEEIKAAKEQVLSSKHAMELDTDGERGRTFAPSPQSRFQENRQLSNDKELAQANQHIADRFANGNARSALDELDRRGNLAISQDETRLRQRLIDDWRKAGGIDGNIIIARSSSDVTEWNQLAQQNRKENGELGKRLKIGDGFFHEGDLVRFQKTDRQWGMKKGEVGKITNITSSTGRDDLVTVTLNNNRKVAFSRKEYKELQLAYATTVKNAKQGDAENNAYIWAKGDWSRHQAYDAVSVAQKETRLYAHESDVQLRDAAIQMLSERMSQEQGEIARKRSEQELKQQEEMERSR